MGGWVLLIIRTFLFLYGLSFSSKSKPPLCLLCSSGSTNTARLRVGFKSLYQLPVPVEGQCAVAHSTVPLQLAFKIGRFRPVPDFAGLRSAAVDIEALDVVGNRGARRARGGATRWATREGAAA